MKKNHDLNAVVDSIKEAFKNTQPPAQIARRRDGFTDDVYGSEEEDVTKQMKGKVWHSMKKQDFLPNWDMLPLLTPEAFHYFLPAFLLNALQYDTDEFIDTTAESTVWSLIPRSPGQNFYSDFFKRVSLLSPSQRIAVANFVSHWKTKFPDSFDYFEVDRAEETLKFWSTPSLQPPFTSE